MTLSIMTLSITTISIGTLAVSISTSSKMALHIVTLS
jgi:hypothetical protein